MLNNGSADTLSSVRTTGRYSGERVADTLLSLHTITHFFCHHYQKTRITLAVMNILINYRQSGCGSERRKTEQLNSAAVVGEVTSRAEPRTSDLDT